MKIERNKNTLTLKRLSKISNFEDRNINYILDKDGKDKLQNKEESSTYPILKIQKVNREQYGNVYISWNNYHEFGRTYVRTILCYQFCDDFPKEFRNKKSFITMSDFTYTRIYDYKSNIKSLRNISSKIYFDPNITVDRFESND